MAGKSRQQAIAVAAMLRLVAIDVVPEVIGKGLFQRLACTVQSGGRENCCLIKGHCSLDPDLNNPYRTVP